MFFEENFIFFPSRGFQSVPSDFNLEFSDIFFKDENDIKLHGWFIPAQKSSKSVILYFHGNGGNISDCLENIVQLNKKLQTDVFIIDYPGYGKSLGKPTEKTILSCGKAAINKLKTMMDESGSADKKIIYFGHSLGGAVAVDLALSDPCNGLVMESTFTSMPDVATHLFPTLPLASIMRTRFESIIKIPKITCPLLVIHGENDKTIAISHGQKLFDAATGTTEKTFYPVPGADHNDTFIVGGGEYFVRLGKFIKNIEIDTSE